MSRDAYAHPFGLRLRAMSPHAPAGEPAALLNTKTTALVLIDLQKGVLARPLLPHTASNVYARSKALASRLRPHAHSFKYTFPVWHVW
jgi:hypothetical protein